MGLREIWRENGLGNVSCSPLFSLVFSTFVDPPFLYLCPLQSEIDSLPSIQQPPLQPKLQTTPPLPTSLLKLDW